MEPLIKAQNLNFTYNKGKDNEYQALININFEIYPEEFIIMFGPSGCGKSTLLNLVAGLERPAPDTMYVFGKDLHNMSKYDFAMYHRTEIGMIYQQYNLITSLTVLENVSLPQLFVNVNKGKRHKWARQLLERFGILKQARKIPSELSGGQQQRIGIARAIVNNPKIVLADEPVGNLDSVSAKNVLDILGQLNEKEKKTVILVTHNPEYLIYGDRIFYMKDGVITREVVNKDKRKLDKTRQDLAPKSPTTEINDLMRAYHGLTPEQINILIMPYKAKAFAHHFISSRSLEETKILEDLIQRRLLGTISQEDFFQELHRSSLEGGVGFDIRTAEKILRRTNRIVRTAYYIYQEEKAKKNEYGQREKVTDNEKAKKVTWYLLGSCYFEHYKNLEEAQINRLQKAVKDRIVGTRQKKDFMEFLDKPFKEGGVGLNVKTAKAMTEELELVLVLGFGIVQKSSMEEKEKKQAEAKEVNLKKTGAKEDGGEKQGGGPGQVDFSTIARNIAAQNAGAESDSQSPAAEAEGDQSGGEQSGKGGAKEEDSEEGKDQGPGASGPSGSGNKNALESEAGQAKEEEEEPEEAGSPEEKTDKDIDNEGGLSEEGKTPPAASGKGPAQGPEEAGQGAKGSGEDGNTLYLSGEEAAQFARTGAAFDSPEQDKMSETAKKAAKLAEEASEAGKLAEEAEKILAELPEEGEVEDLDAPSKDNN